MGFRENLRRLIDESPLSKREIGRRAGLGDYTIRDILKNESQSPRYATLQALARVLGVTVGALMDDPEERLLRKTVSIVGAIEDGAYRSSARWSPDEWKTIPVVPDARLGPDVEQFGYVVRGTSGEPQFADQTVLLAVDPAQAGRPLRLGHILVCERPGPGGLVEVVLRQVTTDGAGGLAIAPLEGSDRQRFAGTPPVGADGTKVIGLVTVELRFLVDI